MDREEFSDFLMQSDVRPVPGRMIRLTLVRSVNSYISSKITNERYIKMKSVHLDGNYRFIITNFTHSEYSKFRKDFGGDLDFLKFNHSNFRRIVRKAFENKFELTEFFSRGNGKISIRSPINGSGSQFLLMDMESREKEGFFPYMVKLRNDAVTLRVRADFNFFLSRMDRSAALLIYQIAKDILAEESDLYERLARFRYMNAKNSQLPFVTPEYIKLHPSHTMQRLRSEIRGSFNMVSDDMGRSPVIYVTDRYSGKWVATMRVLGDVAEIAPGTSPSIDSFLTILDIFSRDGPY